MDPTAQPIQQPIVPTPAPQPQPVVPPPPPVTNKTGWMPKKTLLLIILLAVITIFLLVIALNIKTQPTSQTVAKPTVVSHAYTTLTLSQPVASSSGYQSDVMITTNANKITAVQLELTYDPSLITVTDIVPGSFIQSPVVLLKKIVPETGRITYALGINLGQQPVSGSGVLATIEFTPVAGQTKQANIDILSTTEVAAQNELKSVLKSYNGIKFPLISPTPTE